MAAALSMAAQSTNKFEEVLSVTDAKGPNSTSLSGLNNLLDSYMQPQVEQSCKMAKAAITLNKAALLTFQAWHHQQPGIVGLLFGKTRTEKSKRWICCTVIVADSFEQLFREAPGKIPLMGLRPVGVCFAAGEDDEEATKSALPWSRKCLDDAFEVAVQVKVRSSLSGPFVFYIYIYLYICFFAWLYFLHTVRTHPNAATSF